MKARDTNDRWHAEGTVVLDGNGLPVASCADEDDARLMAEAPELATMLQTLVLFALESDGSAIPRGEWIARNLRLAQTVRDAQTVLARIEREG